MVGEFGVHRYAATVISAVVINWNGRHYLEACLDSLRSQESDIHEILLVDNHSDDGSRDFVEEHYPEVRILDTGYNAGPGYARNMGVQAASGDRVLLVDNDVVMNPGCLKSLSATMSEHPNVAAVQARSVCADDATTVHYDATDIHYLGLLVLHNWFRPLAEADRPASSNGGLVALCFLVDRERYLASGGFNADLFILFEDTDLAWRLRMAGSGIRLDPDAIVLHGGGTKDISMRGAGATYPARRVFLHSRNRWLVLLTCLHWRSLLVLAPAQLAYGAVQFVFACVRLHPLAWVHGKLSFLRYLPRAWKWRQIAQATRCVSDRELLVGGPLTLNPGLADGGLAGGLYRVMNASFQAYFRLFGRLCG
jgi:GT2 family glycosyltransferase